MKMETLLSLLCVLNLSFTMVYCNSEIHNKDKSVIKNNMQCDTVTRENFFSRAKEVKNLMDNKDRLSLDKAIVTIKVYNTLHIADISNDDVHNEFIVEFKRLFEKEYLEKVAKQIEYSYGKGMTIYSKKYDLYIGAGSEFRCKDVYTISYKK